MALIAAPISEAEGAPPRVIEVDPWEGNDMSAPKVFRVLDHWEWTWKPRETPTRWYRNVSATVKWSLPWITLKVDMRFDLTLATDVGAPGSIFVATPRTNHQYSYHWSYHHASERACELAHFALQPLEVFDGQHEVKTRAIFPPLCGQRTVALEEEHQGVTFRTCVDRAWRDAPDIDQLVMILDPDDRLELVMLLAPLPLDGSARDDDAPGGAGLLWPADPSCPAYFPPLAPRDLGRWQKNIGVALHWAEPDELLAVQLLEDDHETGLFVLLYADGRPATVGYMFQGLQHGMWYYHAPDGCLVEARLYALGAELSRPRVAMTRAPGP